MLFSDTVDTGREEIVLDNDLYYLYPKGFEGVFPPTSVLAKVAFKATLNISKEDLESIEKFLLDYENPRNFFSEIPATLIFLQGLSKNNWSMGQVFTFSINEGVKGPLLKMY